MSVTNAWSGAFTPTGFTVAAKVSSAATLVASTAADLSSPIRFGPVTPDAVGIVKLTASGLAPATRYYWGIETGAVVDATWQGQVKTSPNGPGSFSFWSSSCALSGSNHQVFDRIAALTPDFGLHMGDIHYQNIGTNDPALFNSAFDAVLANARQANLYRKVPTVYTWDDHDYGPDNSDKNSPARPAAHSAYRQRVPHHPLTGTEGIQRTFVVGRVRFIILDTRSYRDTAGGTLLGPSQKAWLKTTLLEATEPLIFLQTGVPWLGTTADTWGDAAFSAERLELANYMVANGVKGRLILVGGDQHGLSYDNGTNNTVGGLNAPVLQTAALDQTGSDKGGVYSTPVSQGGDRFGVTQVTDTGGSSISVTMTGYAAGATYFTDTQTFSATVADPPPPSYTFKVRRNGIDYGVRVRQNGVDLPVSRLVKK